MQNTSILAHLIAACISVQSFAQIPGTLLHSIPPPFGVALTNGQLGTSVAVEGPYAVAGAPRDALGTGLSSGGAGAVKVFDSTTGTLLLVLPNPSPGVDDNFGNAVAISGTLVAVGAYHDVQGIHQDAGTVYVFDLSSGMPTVPLFVLSNPGPAGNQEFGGAVSISGSRVVVGAQVNDTGATDAGCAYVYDLGSATPTVPVLVLNNPAPAANDNFGNAVAISGTQVIVSAWKDDAGASDAGSAYAYDLTSGSPTVPVVTLNNPSPAVNDYFGTAVAISGSRVVVGAYGKDGTATDMGIVYEYDLSGGTPGTPVATVPNPGTAPYVYFGNAVAISGMQVAIGAFHDGLAGLNAGRAFRYVFGGTTPAATLVKPSAGMNQLFGNAVAISAARVLVGAPTDDTGALNAGSAYLYDTGVSGSASSLATLNNPGPSTFDVFGSAVAISGTRLVVGAPRSDVAASDAGSAYVYDLSSGTPTVPLVALHDPSGTGVDYFGTSVAISGTLVAVGAPNDDTGASNAGRVYIYNMSSGTPSVPVFTLNNPSPTSGDEFGGAVAISGQRVIVGAPMDDTGANNAGSAYLYDLGGGSPTMPVLTFNNPTLAADDRFGNAVAISGARLVIGAHLDDAGASNAGAAFVYDVTSGTSTAPVVTLNNPAPGVFDEFGFAVALSGTRVVIGAYSDDTGADGAGRAYVYDVASGTPHTPIATLNDPSPVMSDAFGWSVAISGAHVVVGAYKDHTAAGEVGSAYVYDIASGSPSVPLTTLGKTGAALGDQFAYSVAIDGTTIVVGARLDDIVMTDKGGAYVFGPNLNDQDSDGLLDSWELSHWPTITGHTPFDDQDYDGLVELLELAFGLNPSVSNPGGIPGVTEEGGYLTMTIIKQAGVTYEIQSAGALLPGQSDSFSAATTTVLTNNATTLKARDNFLIGTTPQRFMRVKVTAAP